MSVRVVRYEDTPNPNALKCVLSGRLPPIGPADRPLRSYASLEAARAADDEIGAALLEVPGLASVLLTADWITVVRSAGADWKPIKTAIDSALARLTGGLR